MTLTVLTGDIVGSSDITPATLDTLMADLRAGAATIGAWAPDAGFDAAFVRRGGDGWQIAFAGPRLSLRAALYLQAGVRMQGATHATRIAAATGQGEVPAGADLNSARGPAFEASGRLLDTLPAQVLMSHAQGGATDAAFVLADHIAKGWTPAQARAMHAMLPPAPGPRRVAAEALGISRQAVDQALHAAGFPAIDSALDRFETARQ